MNTLINLHHSDTCWRDSKAKSPSFFAMQPAAMLTLATINQLKDMATRTGENVRVSLHENPEAALHDMVICQRHDRWFLPKKHQKAKTFHILDGWLAIFLFDNDGNVLDACKLNPQTAPIYRVGPNLFHADIPMSKLAVHHEITTGPFLGAEDRVIAPWCPNSDDHAARERLRDHLLSVLARQAA